MKVVRSLPVLLLAWSAAFAAVATSRVNATLHYTGPAAVLSASDIALHAYNVVNYDLHMDWYDALSGKAHGFSGKMEVSFVPSLSNPLDSIHLDCNPAYLHVDSVFSGVARLGTSLSGEKLTVFLSAPLIGIDTGTVAIYYHETDPGIAPAPDSLQRGFYLYYAGENTVGPNSTEVPATVAYTMSEPSDARDWMPCYDKPSDKALCEISVRVPDGYTAASNGLLVGDVNNGDGSVTFSWKESYPVATYLMCATAAHYALIQKNANIGGRQIPVQYYVYPQDSLQAVEGSGCNIDSVISMIKFYSSIYAPYPFEKYGMTGVEPFQYGGMEHQTITTLNRSDEFNRRDVAHELAHQWWGDMVTLGTWKDIWLNEGFATYSEAMQLQHDSQRDFENEMDFYASQFFVEDSTQLRYAIYAPPPGYIFGLAEYYKAAWVLNMLRNIVGDSTYFSVMRRYRADYQYRNAVTADFVNVADTVSHSDMSWFFDEWIFDAGYPVYTKSFEQDGDSLALTIRQTQSNAPVFRMPMEVGVWSGGRMTLETVLDSLQSQTFSIYFPARVDSVILDPNNEILARYPGQSLTSVGQVNVAPATYALLQNYPNPFNDRTEVVYRLPEPGMVSLELYDILGQRIETLVNSFQTSGTHTVALSGAALASGVYLCRLVAPGGRLTTKLVLEK